jgi:heme/copper-type cytochrome/quinol oxidase subunit 3
MRPSCLLCFLLTFFTPQFFFGRFFAYIPEMPNQRLEKAGNRQKKTGAWEKTQHLFSLSPSALLTSSTTLHIAITNGKTSSRDFWH